MNDLKIIIYTDITLPLAIKPLCRLLNSVCRTVKFSVGSCHPRFTTKKVSRPRSYENLPSELIEESKGRDYCIICTGLPYDNKYFFDYDDEKVILSFAEWNQLTSSPIANGLAYFLVAFICEHFEVGIEHDGVTCVNDFLSDKSGVDSGMRAAQLCDDCRETATGKREVLQDIDAVLDLIGVASRENKDISDFGPGPASPGTVDDERSASSHQEFDVFLCHNSLDKDAVRAINAELQSNGIRTWFDEEQLMPGDIWQVVLESKIGEIRNVIVCVGPNAMGPWHDFEMRAFLSEFVRRRCRVIPLLLPDAPEAPPLPLLLSLMTWTDLRKDYDRNFARLVKAIGLRQAKAGAP
jgi:hypothetical protein